MGCKKSQENFVDSKLINKTLSETAARSRQNLFTFRLRVFATWQRHYTIYMHVLPAIREMKCPDLQQANWEAGSTQQQQQMMMSSPLPHQGECNYICARFMTVLHNESDACRKDIAIINEAGATKG